MVWCILFPVLGIISLVFFLKERIRKASALSLIWKTLTSLWFLALAFCAVWKASEKEASAGFSLLVLAGLFCGLLGDIWLDLKWNCPEYEVQYTFAGFWSFAAGHGFFLAALLIWQWRGEGIWWILVPLVLAAILGIAVGCSGRLMHLDYGRYKGITMFYGGMLIATALLSGSLLIRSGFKNTALWMFFTGAVLFLISDLILSGTYFGTGKRRSKDIISNHIFYYAAQYIIAGTAMVYAAGI